MKTITLIGNLSFALIMLVAVSCTSSQGEGSQQNAAQVKEYQVLAVKPQRAKLHKEYPATLQGQQTVEIRTRIAGYIEEILVDEGAHVKKGQVLFRLNANDIQANVRSAEAQVKVAEAEVVAAKINLEKTKPLVEKDIISQFDLQSVESVVKAREAQLAQAIANLENAKANLQYTLITSPTDGIIGNFPYRVGSLVSSSSMQPLTTVSNTINMYAYFSMNEKEFLSLTKGLEGKNLNEKLATMPEVLLVQADGSLYGHAGRIETAGGLVDQQTGAINIRASFPNTESFLRSGGSGLIRIPQHIDSTIIIPQKATYELQGKHFVYVVGDDNIVQNTEIEVLTGNLKDSYLVTKGLKAGDKVVVEGIPSLRDKVPIKPKMVEAEELAENTSEENPVNN